MEDKAKEWVKDCQDATDLHVREIADRYLSMYEKELSKNGELNPMVWRD